MHRFGCYVTAIFMFFITNTGYSQSDSTVIVTTMPQSNIIDSTITGYDSARTNTSIINIPDSSATDSTVIGDSTKTQSLEERLGIRISKDALPSVVTATARDSAVLDMEHDVFYLYGKAKVDYEDLKLEAGQVSYTQATNVVTAEPSPYENDTGTKRPSFQQGKEKFTYDSMQYNFKSKRAIVRNVRSQYGEGFIFSEQVKRNPDQSIYGWHSVYTTCALETPHFGIRARKQKVIPGKVIVSGSANLEIEGVPTPLYLPFGLFPASQTHKSGFVLPTYTIEQQRGFGLLNGGYYFYVNDNVDVLAQANMYTKGSYMVSGTSNYNRMYHYRGALRMSYAFNKTGEDFEPDASTSKDFMINWTHSSDPKSVPGQAFNASVQAGSSSFYSKNSYDPNQILQNQYQSNISYSKNWQNRPFGLTLSALHNQNTQTRQVNVTLPSANFYINQFNPFQNKNAIGNHWYDKITASYSADFQNRTTFYDSALNLNNLSLTDFQNGLRQSIPVSASYTVARHINMSFSLNYNEYWLTNQIFQGYNDATGKIDSQNNNGFYATRDFNTGVNLSTRIYGMKLFRNGKLRGIRHVLTPSTGFSYRPDFAVDPFNYYYRARLDTSQNLSTLSPYVSSIIGIPPQGKSAAINFGLNNNLQIKVRSSKDSSSEYKNVTLIDGFSVNTSYNIAADSFNWSPLSVNFRTNIADKINISGSAVYSPYAFDYGTGKILRETMLQHGTGIARFQSSNISLGTNFHSKPRQGSEKRTNSEEYKRIMYNAGYNSYVDFNIPWSFNVNYSLNINSQYSGFSYKDTVTYSQTLTFNGELQVTERWKVSVNSGYNFDYKQLTLTSIDVYRDLHCWAIHFLAYPFGPRKSFNFRLNVKSTVLQDLKLVRRRDFRDIPN